MPDETSTASTIQKFFQDNPTLLPSLITGTGGGLVGGLISASRPLQAGEDRSARRRRILKNALISALSTGGATGLGLKAYETLSTAVPKSNKTKSPGEHLLDTAASTVNTGVIPAATVLGARYLGGQIDARTPVMLERVRNALGSNEKFLDAWAGTRLRAAQNLKGSDLSTNVFNINNKYLQKLVGKNFSGLLSRGAGLIMVPGILSDLKKGVGLTDK